MRDTPWIAAAAITLALFGCGEDATPPAETAEESLEQFTQAVDEMKAGKDRLQEETQALREQFKDQLDKYLALLQDRIAAYESHLTGLPAEREVQLRQAYEGLQQQASEVRALYEQWSQATGEQATQLRSQLDERKQQLEEAFERFETQVAEAKTSG